MAAGCFQNTKQRFWKLQWVQALMGSEVEAPRGDTLYVHTYIGMAQFLGTCQIVCLLSNVKESGRDEDIQ
jgi:hypothetical protein